jgi:hypothetical protein
MGARVKGESPPRQSPDTAWESDLGVVRPNRRCATIPDAVWELCGMASVTPWHCAAHSRPSTMPHPSKKDGGALERRTTTDPAPAQDDAVM